MIDWQIAFERVLCSTEACECLIQSFLGTIGITKVDQVFLPRQDDILEWTWNTT